MQELALISDRLAAIQQKSRDGLKQRQSILDTLFPAQLAFVADTSKRKAALCSRRAGKSHGMGCALVLKCLESPGALVVYAALTHKSAKRILWPVLKRIDSDFNLGIRWNNTELTGRFPNGSEIWLTGADDEGQIDKLRGSAYHMVVIDEAGHFGAHLDAFIDEVIEPALLDHNGTLSLIGTPSASCVGKFFDITTGADNGYTTHRWTVLDNPHIPHAAEWLERRCREMGWDDHSPVYLREWRGRWIKSLDSLVYRHTAANIIDAIPAMHWNNVLGIDLGYDDDTAFSIVSFSKHSPTSYIHGGWKSPRLTVSEVATKARWYVETYNPVSVVCDTGGGGKMIAEEIAQRYGLPIVPAEKTDKYGTIELLNADLKTGRVKVKRGDPVLSEWDILQWDDKRKKEDDRFPNHASDSVLYAWRESIHWAHRPGEVLPKAGTVEYAEREARIMEEQEEEEGTPWWAKEPKV